MDDDLCYFYQSRVQFYFDVMELICILCCLQWYDFVLFIVAGAKFRSRAAAASDVKVGQRAGEREQRKNLASRRQRSRSVESLFSCSQHNFIAGEITSGNYRSVAVVILGVRE